jgi:hypothetical protein
MRCDDSVDLRKFETENAMQWRWRFEGIDDEEYGFEGIGDGEYDAMTVSIDLRE